MTRQETNPEHARRKPPVRAFRSALLGWTDPESGDRLTVTVRGSEAFLADLEPLGFEPLGLEPLGFEPEGAQLDAGRDPALDPDSRERLSAELTHPRCPVVQDPTSSATPAGPSAAKPKPMAPAPPRGTVRSFSTGGLSGGLGGGTYGKPGRSGLGTS